MSKQINIRVSDKQYDALTERAEIYGMSIVEYIRFIISIDLKDYFDFKGRGVENE